MVSCADAVYAVPVVHVIEAVRLLRDDVQTIDGKEVFRLRGNVVPLLRLADTLGLRSNGINNNDMTFVVVVKLGERLVGLGVDGLIELQDIVVKSLGEYTGDARGVAGASILGDGRVSLILDVAALLDTACRDQSCDDAVSRELAST